MPDLSGLLPVPSSPELARRGRLSWRGEAIVQLLRRLAPEAGDWAHLFPVLPHQSEANRRTRWLWGAFEQFRATLAARQLKRRFGSKVAADRDERARRAQFLLRRGFDPATVRAAARAEIDDPGEEFD